MSNHTLGGYPQLLGAVCGLSPPYYSMMHPARMLAPASVLLLAFANPALAEIKLHETLAVSGFVSGSYTLDEPSSGPSTDHFGLDEALLSFQVSSDPVGATLGLYHEPGAPKETKLHDAFLTYTAAGGTTLTAGKFQSLIAYESYYAVDNPTISFANNELLTIAPGYHSGLKVERDGETWSVGAALLDSLYTGGRDAKGDGELKDNQGYEALVSFTGVKDLVLTVSSGHEGRSTAAEASWVYDAWATYQFASTTLFAANWSAKDGGPGDSGTAWLALVNHDFTGRLSAVFRVSGDRLEGGGNFTRYTVAPTFKLTPALTLRAEYSRSDHRNTARASSSFFGVQAFLRF